MGYDLHISRRKRWSDNDHEISANEWLAYIQGDPELRLQPERGPCFAFWIGASELPDPWLDWCDGQIYTKNPDAALVDKVVAIARSLTASVQGDDGEFYVSSRQAPRQLPPSLLDRALNWFRGWRTAPSSGFNVDSLPFAVGERVRDSWGNEHIVIQMDSHAEHGMGVIKTRRADGTELTHLMIGHGLSPIADV